MLLRIRALAFSSMLSPETAKPIESSGAEAASDAAPRRSRSSSCSWPGGHRHLETFDPKPLLNKLDGQKRPAEFGESVSVRYDRIEDPRDKRTFKKYGKSGIEVSDLFPHRLRWSTSLRDSLLHGDMVVHSAAQYQMMTGRIIPDSRHG